MEIRGRAKFVWDLEHDNSALFPEFGRIESIVLQIRKILELIAVGSLVANKELYSENYKKFETHSHAKYILNDIERINSEFYPKPAIQTRSDTPGVNWHLVTGEDIGLDYLTRIEFENIYDKCGGLLHAENPFGSKRDYKYYLNNIPAWMKKIENLLKIHVIRLADDENHYLIHMKSGDNKAHGYTLSPR